MTTKILGTQIENFSIDTAQLAANVTAGFVNKSLLTAYANAAAFAVVANALAPKINTVSYANSAFAVLDDTAVNVGGGYIVVTGENFQNGATVIVDNTSASAVTYVNSTVLNVQVPTKSAATYNLYVVNPSGGTGVRVNAITYSANPNWVTTSPLARQSNNSAFAITLSATDATSYAVANGSTLPAGTALLANGYFYGNVTIGSDTTYSFDVVATDAELQDSSKTFGITVQVAAPRRLWAWGSGNMLGLNGVVIDRSSPVQVGTDLDWSIVQASWDHSLAIKTDGTLWTWGTGTFGQLGLNTITSRSSPTQIGTDTNWSKLSGQQYATMAIKTTGTLWGWGYNAQGTLGLNTNTSRSSPVQVGTATDWAFLSENNNSATAAIKTTGTLWTWGYGFFGVLGNNTVVTRSSPVQVGALTNWSKVGIDGQNTAAIKTDGTLWTWGYGPFGSLGNNTIVTRSSPVQVGALTNWSQIDLNNYVVVAIKTDGTLWVWGYNNAGQLGLNNLVNRSSPVQIGTDTNWSKISISSTPNVLLTKTNGTLWTWGNGATGKLGTNDIITRSSPVQIGSYNGWNEVSIGTSHAIAIAG